MSEVNTDHEDPSAGLMTFRETLTDNDYLPTRKFDSRTASTCNENGRPSALAMSLLFYASFFYDFHFQLAILWTLAPSREYRYNVCTDKHLRHKLHFPVP